MDLCEMINPFCIVSCSLDKTIHFYSYAEKEQIKVIRGEHEKGVKKLAYTAQFDGHLVSLGNETFANVWGPEAASSDLMLGRLKGHTKPLNDTKFLG